MRLGVLETGAPPAEIVGRYGSYPSMFRRLFGEDAYDDAVFDVAAGEMPAGVAECGAWLVTGSSAGAYDPEPWIAPLEDFLRAAKGQAPLVGICFGHQIIAQALGGKVQKYGGGWSVGPTEYDFGDRTYRLNAWHQDQVVKKPETAKVLASTAMCENAALLYDDRMFTVQPHPEFRKEFMAGLIQHRGPGLVPDALLADATARIDTPLDSPSMADRIADFFLTHQTGAEKLRA